MMLPGTLSSMEVLRRPPPASGRPRERPIALGSAGSRACSCPPRFAWPRSAGCADPCPCAPCRSCAGHGWRPGCLHKVEAMSDHLAGGGFYGRGSTKAGEGSVAPQSLGIVPGHDQQRPRVVGADSRQGEQLRGGICHQPIELDIQLGYLLREGLVTSGHRTERELDCRLRCFGLSAWAQAAGGRNEPPGREPAQALTQAVWGCDHE